MEDCECVSLGLTVPPVVNKCKRRHKYIVGSVNAFLLESLTNAIPAFKFFSSFMAMLCATVPVSILGTRFGMSVVPFWTPERFSERSAPPENGQQSYQVSSPRRWDVLRKLHFRDRSFNRLCPQGVCVCIWGYHYYRSKYWLLISSTVRIVIRLKCTSLSVHLGWRRADQLQGRLYALR